MKIRGIVWATHPFLWAIFPVLSLYASNLGEVLLSDLWQPLVWVGVLAIFSYLIFVIITNNYYRAAIHASFFLILFFSYGHVFTLLDSSSIVMFIFSHQVGRFTLSLLFYLAPAWVIFLIVGEWWLLKKSLNYQAINKYFFITGVVLTGISLFTIIPYEMTRPVIKNNDDNNETSISAITETSLLPDVYYIILDGYSRGDTLERMFGDDNEDFLNLLRERDFIVASNSRTNYVHTASSLASSLNMEYVNYLTERYNQRSDDHTIPFQMIKNNRLSRSLKSIGYSFVSFNSKKSQGNDNPFADKNIDYPLRFDFDDFDSLLINNTILQPFLAVTEIRRNREALRYNLDQLSDLPNYADKPVFVFAHFVAPHPPFYFDKNCEREPILANDSYNKEKYYGMLLCINKQIIEAVDNILDKSQVPPIIVIQGDHGSDLSRQFIIEYEDLDKTEVDERTNILNAYYVPNVDRGIWYDSITPVNSWRMILKHYYGAEIDLLPDKTYWSEKKTPYIFIEVD